MDGHSRLEIPREHLLHDRCRTGFRLHARGIAWVVKIEPVAKEWPTPGQQLSRTHFREAPTAHPLAEQRTLKCRDSFGDSSPDLQQQLVVGILAHGALQELDCTAVLLKFLNEEHLVHIFAGQPIRGGHHNPVELRETRLGHAVGQVQDDSSCAPL